MKSRRLLDKTMKKKSYKCTVMPILLAVAVTIIILLLLLLLRSCEHTDENKATPDSKSITEHTGNLDFTPYEDYNGNISIPAVNGLYLIANQLEQTVNFYNPDTNNCYFMISLYLSDGTKIFKSGYLAPSEELTEIKLNQILQRGLYNNCKLIYDCYSLDDKSPLNNGEIIIEINSM